MQEHLPVINEGFPETEWHLVEAAGLKGAPKNVIALEALLHRYLPILKGHLVFRYHVTEDQANDWLQSFVLKQVMEKDLIAQADSKRGKFRTFLLHALHNFVIQQIRHDQAGKRSPSGGSIQIEDLTEADLSKLVDTARTDFDVAWARGVLIETLHRMERQCLQEGRTDILGIFECRILKPLFEQTDPLPYDQVVAKFGLQSPAQASNLLITAKRMFGRILRSVIGEYARDEEEIQNEIQELKAILFRA